MSGSLNTLNAYASPMHRWIDSAAGGTSQRSKPGGAVTRFSVTASRLDRQGFEAYLDAFLNEARIDTPDRTAITDNPLRITGFSARPGR